MITVHDPGLLLNLPAKRLVNNRQLSNNKIKDSTLRADFKLVT